jgi:hypothetical protein
MRELDNYQPLPDDVRKLIEEPLVPFDQLRPSDPDRDLYELDDRQGEGGKYEVHLLMRKIGGETILLTRIESSEVEYEMRTPNDRGLDHLTHIFSGAPEQVVDNLFRKAA